MSALRLLSVAAVILGGKAFHMAQVESAKTDFESGELTAQSVDRPGVEPQPWLAHRAHREQHIKHITSFNVTVCETVKPDPGCTAWCLKPPWRPGGAQRATHLDCCAGDQSDSMKNHTWGFEPLIVGYLFTGEPDMLRSQIRRWAQLSFDTLRQVTFLLVVDLDEQLRPALWPEDPWGIVIEETNIIHNRSQLPAIHMVSVDTFKPWNIGGKRNLLFKEAGDVNPDAWVLMLDADLVFEESFLTIALRTVRSSGSGTAYQFRRTGIRGSPWHPAAMLLRVDDYWKSGGCDEDFVGHYGQTDPHFKYRLAKSGLRIAYQDNMVVSQLLVRNATATPMGTRLPLDRSTEHNRKLYDAKKRGGRWSNVYLRFDWGRIRRMLKPSLSCS